MMSSDRTPQKTLDKILRMLSDEKMARQIDGPIDQIAESYQFPPVIRNGRGFDRFVIHTLRNLHAGGSTARRLSDAEALAEGRMLLDTAMPNGYDEALLKAADGVPGVLEGVVGFLAEAVKQQQRELYISWVYDSCLSPLDWRLRRSMASYMLTAMAQSFGEDYIGVDPARMTECLRDLVEAYASVVVEHGSDVPSLDCPYGISVDGRRRGNPIPA